MRDDIEMGYKGYKTARGLTVRRFILLTCVVMMDACPAAAQDGGPGMTEPLVLPAFDPNTSACSKPVGLNRVLAYVQENEREFLQGVHHGLEMAAKDRGLQYHRSLVENDVGKAVKEIQTFRAAKVGALVATSSDPSVVSGSLQQTIWSGRFCRDDRPAARNLAP